MTEKRFMGSSGGVYDQYKGDRFTWAEWEEILQIMNNLNEKARERSKALSKLQKENEQLKALLECSREEANDYCEELIGKDELIRLYKRHIDEAIEEIKQLRVKTNFLDDIDRNCYNCKHCDTYDEGPGYGFVSLCEKDCMNTDGYFDYEYHKFKSSVVCPFWEHGDDQ